MLGQLNDVRHAAGLPPLALEPKQSQVNQRLAPHLYQASTDGNTELQDRIGLGVLAGWDVEGVLRDGGVHSGSVTSTRSPGRYLSYTLESPFARFILLPWPDVLLNRDPLQVEVGVTHYKAPGGAWGQYALIFIIREPRSLKTARAAARARL